MRAISIVLGLIGLLMVVVGAVRAYKGRMREVEPGIYSIPASTVFDMWLAISGATVSALGGIVGSFG